MLARASGDFSVFRRRGTSRLSPRTFIYSDSAYAPFGEQYAPSGTTDASFTGQNADTTSALYDFTFRELSPTQGRWISPDPAGLAAADPTNPQSWNRYAYVADSPLNYWDALGLERVYTPDGCWYDDDPQAPAGITCPNQSTGTVSSIYTYFDTYTSTFLFGGGGAAKFLFGGGGAANNGQQPCSASTSATSIWSGNVTTNAPTIAAGAAIGEAIGGPPGAFLGGIIGSFFGVGGTASYVPSTKSLYAGPTLVFAPALGGGSGSSGNVVSVPAGQNPNAIANGLSYSVTFQPSPLLGSTVVKSPGSGSPVVGPSVGTRIPVSFGVSYNFPVKKGGC